MDQVWKKKPFFFTKQIPDEAVPQHIKDYCEAPAEQEVTRKIWLERCQCKCCSFLTRSCVDMWNNGQSPTVIHCTIDYQATKNFAWFVEQVTEVRRTGDVDKRKGLLANVFRLLENSSYRKLTYWGTETPNLRDLHKGWEGGVQSATKRVLQQSGRARASVWAGKPEVGYHNQSTLPDRNRCVSAGKAEDAWVLLRFLR